MRNDQFNILALAASGLFITACPNTNDANIEANDDVHIATNRNDVGLPTVSPDSRLRCCPTGFALYACQEPGGKAGLACHNPAMGCASSETCGQGCDPQVSGRCACVQTELCIRGDHFDTTVCKCVPNQDAGTVCIDNVLCIVGDHFDMTVCKCVPNQDAGTVPPADAKPVCIDNVLCMTGDHFDTTVCKCVPDAS